MPHREAKDTPEEAVRSLSAFTIKGDEFTKLNDDGSVAFGGDVGEAEANAALAAFKPLGGARRISSLTKSEKVSIPKEGGPDNARDGA